MLRKSMSFLVAGMFSAIGTLFGQNAVWTYQGRLTQGGQPANGTYDLRFTLMDSVTLGNNIAGPITNASTIVSSGMFTAPLTFPASAFDGSVRWVEIGVR